MSLPAFQQVLSQLIADRAFCRGVREHPAMALAGRDLSPREMRRLATMAAVRGMTASGTLYRLNRLTPLRRCLPRTLTALGSTLPGLIDAFWRAYPETRLQFEEEAMRFATFVEAQITAGMIVPPLVTDTLAFEATACRLFFQNDGKAPAENSGATRLQPLVSVVRFQIEPTAVFAGYTDARSPGEHYVVLDARGPELRARVVPVAVGRVLAMAQAGADVADDSASRSARAAGWMRESMTTATSRGCEPAIALSP